MSALQGHQVSLVLQSLVPVIPILDYLELISLTYAPPLMSSCYGYDGGYNEDFSDEDMERLLQIATTDSERSIYQCGWVEGQSLCNEEFQGSKLSAHLKAAHGITGPDNAQFVCCWAGCATPMKKESVIRHVQEIHLIWRYYCPWPVCKEHFSRKYTLNQHYKKHLAGSG
ncbi:hypothetical protein F5I97DRAFT_1470252 [Phlebopus sp. FC_14]|nr:hypothetical protein F5I97DRAFT_1470252 [Phlebopus sp. FC_14]